MDKKKIKSSFRYIKILFLLFVTIISFVYTIKFLDKINLDVDDLFLLSLVEQSNNLSGDGFTSDVVNYVISLDFLNPVNLLKNNYKGLVTKPINVNKEEIDNVVQNDNSMGKDPIIKDNNPLVYIYNTHQSEEYTSKNLSIHNIKPTVMTASYILEEKLEDFGFNSIVEEGNVNSILQANNWNYASSYVVSKMLMTKAKNEHTTLKYFIDLHRDSVSRDITTAVINNKSYAKVMFLLGLENASYVESERVITRLNEIITNKYPGISRGIYKKGGPGVNGVYNQDFSNRCILIEVGGVDNTIDEVSNTIDAISEMLRIYIKEDYEQYT